MSLRRLLRASLVLGALLGVSAIVGASPAMANSPWWHLSSVGRPTNLNALSSKLEVQEIRVNAEGGSFVVSEPIATEKGEFENEKGEPTFAILPDSATAEEVELGLEGFYGAGTVHVTGGPETGLSKYLVTFSGSLAFQKLKPIGTHFSEEFSFTAPGQLTTRVVTPPSIAQLIVTAANLGDEAANGQIVIADKLPPHLKAVSLEGIAGESEEHQIGPVQCVLESLTCTYHGSLPAYGQIEVRIGVAVEGAETGERNEVTVSGGGAPEANVSRPITVSEAPTPFGVEDYELGLEEERGTVDTQAGSHPFQFTTSIMLNQITGAMPAALPRDLSFNLPPGLIGDTTPFAQCELARFVTRVEGKDNECPQNTVVGVARITVNEPTQTHLSTFTLPVFNLEPAVGEPARFGILLLFTPVIIDTAVRTGGDYGVTASSSNISQAGGFLKGEVTLWGTPGDSRHDKQRGWGCLEETRGEIPILPCAASGETTPPALMVTPTSCTGPLQTSVQADSWQDPSTKLSAAGQPMPAMDGCNRLQFNPSMSVVTDGQSASTPTGLDFDLHVPQGESLNSTGLVQSSVKDTTVVLPAGTALDPAAADALDACSLDQVALGGPSQPACPDASKVATVEVKTPLLANPLKGAAYVAAQTANPFGSLVAMYVTVEDPVSGTRVKLAGDVHLSPAGQIFTTFENTPQLPFEDFKLHFFEGSRAPLSTPAFCGTYPTTASITPWSGDPAVSRSSSFQITSGPGGAACPSHLPFDPSLTAGSASIEAGAFTPFAVSISREDGEQSLQRIELHTPPGLSGRLTGVPLCGEPQAGEGTCGPGSLIGSTAVSVGLGATPFTITGGRVYLTGPYDRAPFGLSIVTPAKAGPYDLGEGACDCIVVRARIEVDPHTAELSVSTDETGPHAIPSILQGIPLQIKHIDATIDRPDFTFNPTNCNPLSAGASLTSTEGSIASLLAPFQVANCGRLAFSPTLTASTSGRTSKANGASLTVKLVYPKAPFGSQANIASVKVELPKQLPSRLSTLQKACLAATFEADPATCPPGSIVGHAKATTPVLPVSLEGPAYFVSHGGEQFPSLTMVLKGYGVTIDLVGDTFISKAGITSSTFKTVPDIPVSTFELSLPQGKLSALAAYGNLCKSKLSMPTIFTAQNGDTIRRATRIATTKCPRARPRKARSRRARAHKPALK